MAGVVKANLFYSNKAHRREFPATEINLIGMSLLPTELGQTPRSGGTVCAGAHPRFSHPPSIVNQESVPAGTSFVGAKRKGVNLVHGRVAPLLTPIRGVLKDRTTAPDRSEGK